MHGGVTVIGSRNLNVNLGCRPATGTDHLTALISWHRLTVIAQQSAELLPPSNLLQLASISYTPESHKAILLTSSFFLHSLPFNTTHHALTISPFSIPQPTSLPQNQYFLEPVSRSLEASQHPVHGVSGWQGDK